MVTDFRTLSHGASLRSAAELLLATSQRDFPVLSGVSVIGLLTRGALLHAMMHDGPDGFVAGAMERAFQRVAPDADLGEVTGVMGQSGRCRLVMEGERLLGLLTAENVAEFVLLREARAAHRRASDDVF
jgi:CBS domain-containing protein